MNQLNFNDLGKIDSSAYGILPSQSMKTNDFFLNMTFSIGRNNSRFYDLNKQPTNMSQVSVGGFKICKDTAINENGDIIVSQLIDMQKYEDYDTDLDNIMFNNSINVSEKQFTNNLYGSLENNNKYNNNELLLPIGMTCSQEMDPKQREQFKSNLMNKSINKRVIEDIVDHSHSIRQQINNQVSINLSQFYHETMMRNSNLQFKQNYMPISLIDKKIDTLSEPDLETYIHEFSSQHQQNQKEINKDININSNSNKYLFQQMKESTNQGLTIEPFCFIEKQFQDQIEYPHSDEELENKKSPKKLKTINTKEQKKAAEKGSRYRQSRHKNVFKNFGGTLIRFIIYNSYFQERVIQELNKDAQKKKGFQDWLQTKIKLERKKDFQVAWTTFKSDSENIKEYKTLLRELSRDFFENFSFIYLINSKKISDMEIHLRSIHTYLASINNPDSLERFKPI